MSSQTDLGLPLEYQKHPEYFDAININDDTDAKNSVIGEILKKYKVQKVLDMTCGSGSQVFFLKNLGYDVVGADFSPALLNIARKKATENNLDVLFLDGDMRDLHIGEFDAVITIFNAIGHLTKKDFERALKNIKDNLKNGGIYIFDILNLDAMTKSVVENLAATMDRVISGVQIHKKQYSTLDRKLGLLTSYDELTIQSEKRQVIKEQFTLQIYSALELKAMLNRCGFDVLEQCGMMGEEFKQETTLEMLTVARLKFKSSIS